MILGIAGTFNAGKDAAAEYLAENYNFMMVSTGDMVRELSQQLHGAIERSLLKTVADEARAEHGAGYFVELAISKFASQSESKNLAITGVRSIGEVESLKAKAGKLLFIDAPQKLRYERSVNRGRGDAEHSFKEFARNEAIEMKGRGQDKTIINIGAVKKMADIVVINDRSLQQFYERIDSEVLQQLN